MGMYIYSDVAVKEISKIIKNNPEEVIIRSNSEKARELYDDFMIKTIAREILDKGNSVTEKGLVIDGSYNL